MDEDVTEIVRDRWAMVKIGEKKVGNTTIVLLDGKIDSTSSIEVEKKINELIDRGEKYLLVNLSGTEYISSSGLRVMLSSLKRLKKVEGDLKVSCTRPLVQNVFNMAGFTQIFEFYDRDEDALSRFSMKT